ncbi:MAG: hypothetical protein Q9221_002823 [Calogaya cf. arnoldii]
MDPNILSLKRRLITYQWLYVAQILYAPTIFFVKSAILLQYLRLLAPTKSANRTLYISCHVIIVLTLVYYIISTTITIFACSPREKMWNPLITGGHCLNNNAGVLFTSLFNIVSDIIILVLPARSVWKLQIPRAKKSKIVALFATGLLACVANMMIIFYAVRIGQKDADVSYNSAFMGFWVFAEISLGIIVTCTFSLPKLVESKSRESKGASIGPADCSQDLRRAKHLYTRLRPIHQVFIQRHWTESEQGKHIPRLVLLMTLVQILLMSIPSYCLSGIVLAQHSTRQELKRILTPVYRKQGGTSTARILNGSATETLFKIGHIINCKAGVLFSHDLYDNF